MYVRDTIGEMKGTWENPDLQIITVYSGNQLNQLLFSGVRDMKSGVN